MIKKIYELQTELTIKADTEVDITGASATLIKYIKPDGTTGSFTASIDNAVNGIIAYDIVDNTDIVGVGKWILWAHVTFASGKYAAGTPFTMEVFSEGDTC